MADQKISELNAITGANTADDDLLVIVDTSTGETKKITLGELEAGIARGDMTFGDNDKAIFGAGSDLQIYHNGSNSIITETGTGHLYLGGDNLLLANGALSSAYLEAISGGAVNIYHNGSSKLATTSTGIDVTGTATMDGLTVDGDAVVASTVPRLILSETDTVNGNWDFRGSFGNLKIRQLNDDLTTATSKLDINANGDISFYEDTGTTAKFFWDASAESLGIGTSSPSATLDVVGTAPSVQIKSTNAGQSSNTLYGSLDFYNSDADVAGVNGYVRAYTGGNYGVGGALAFGTASTWGSSEGNGVLKERMRIDSSGNLLVGTTDTTLFNNTTGGGFSVSQSGLTQIAKQGGDSADPVLVLNQTGLDGEIQRFYKDGATVGSIGSNSSSTMQVGTRDVNLNFRDDTTNRIIPRTGAGGQSNGVIDLGDGGSRFKDLYLSGGVYLGGTGSANYLDDYEQGTWTPAITNGTANYAFGSYVKVGDHVTIWGFISLSSRVSDSTTQLITGLPFNAADTANGTGWSSDGICEYDSMAVNIVRMPMWLQDSTSQITLYKVTAATSNVWASSLVGSDLNNTTALRFTMTYKAV